MRIFLLFILFLTVFFWSCKKEIESSEPSFVENKYFPLEVGRWVSYQIQEINIDKESAVNDTVSYQIKEKIESIIENTDSYKTYRLERYFRNDSTEEWTIFNVWQIRRFPNRIHKIEENIEYIKLLTPAKINQKWDGNAYNKQDLQEYQLTNFQTYFIHHRDLNTAIVVQQDQESLIDKKLFEEQYCQTIGLIKKTEIDVELNIDPELPWEKKITKGSVYYQNYIDSNE